MTFFITLMCSVVVVVLLNTLIKRWSIIFYLLAIVFTGYYVYASMQGASEFVWRYVLVLFQRCTLSLALFTIVMFIGVLPESSRPRTLLAPIRQELSILACILASGHIIKYLSAFIPRVLNNAASLEINVEVSLALSCILTVLLLVLLITSFTFVHKRMKPRTWKRIQMLAYPFYLLIYVHLLFVLLPSALAGSVTIAINLVIYSLLFMLYAVLRVRKKIVSQTKAKEATVM